MTDRILVLRGMYVDSILLMESVQAASAMPGVAIATALMATPLNLEDLRGSGFDLADDATSHDLVIAVRADTAATLEAAIDDINRHLHARDRLPRSEVVAAPSLQSVVRRGGPGDIAAVSVPGRHAAYEVSTALDAGMHVFCFSSRFPVEIEARLKRRATEAGLLLMGPDCGTAIIDGIGFGFTNAVRQGPVGLVGAAGTGMQEVMCLLDRADVGVSHAIGVGGRDLTEVVGGEMTRQGLARLEADPSTEVAVVVAKAPAAAVQPALIDVARQMSKPVVLALLGSGTDEVDGDVRVVHSLEAGAREAALLAGCVAYAEAIPDVGSSRSGSILGLFCGGSLCQEAMNVVTAAGADATFVDFGDESFTDGRAHPMIDPTIRNRAFEHGAPHAEVAVVLLDVILGRGAHLDPVGKLGPLIYRAIDRRPDLLVVVSVCGVPGDPQDLDACVKRLREAGAAVTLTAAHGARTAVAGIGAEP